LSEFLVVIAITGVLISVTVPIVLSYYHNAQNTTGAQQIRTILNQARQIAIDQRTFVCVQVTAPTQMAFYASPDCTGSPWLGSITDAAGNITLQSGFTMSASEPRIRLSRACPPTSDLHRNEHHDGFYSHRFRGDLWADRDSVSATERRSEPWRARRQVGLTA